MPRYRYSILTAVTAWTLPLDDRVRCSLWPHSASDVGSPGDRFPRSAQEPEPRSRHLYAGHRLASMYTGSRQTHPRDIHGPWFRCHLTCFDTSSVVHSRSSSWLTPDPIRSGPSPQRSPPRLLTDAACGGLGAPLQGDPGGPTSISRAVTHTRYQRSSTSSYLPVLVAHVHPG